MDRKLLKAQAKNLINTADPKPITETVIYIAISVVLSYLAYKLVGSFSESLAMQMERFSAQYGAGGMTDPYQFVYELQKSMPSPPARLLNLAIEIVSLMLSAGYTIFALRTVRGLEASYWNLFDSFSMFFRILWLQILQGIFIALWSLLLIIPGIIAAYRYRMALYLLLEHPEMSAMQCIRESKRLMKGHKWELFVLDFSFIGWLFLVALADSLSTTIADAMQANPLAEVISVIGFGVLVQIYVLPYMELTLAGYYKQLVEQDAAKNMFGGWQPEL